MRDERDGDGEGEDEDQHGGQAVSYVLPSHRPLLLIFKVGVLGKGPGGGI